MQNTEVAPLTATIATVALTLLALLVPTTAVSARPGVDGHAELVAGTWIDTENRQAVADSHEAEFGRSEPAMEWTGDHATCNVGTTSQAHRTSTFQRINWYRAMAGLAPVTENTTYSAQAQQAVLTTSLSSPLSHEPPTSTPCWTQPAFDASVISNLSGGRAGLGAIDNYMIDFGQGNQSVGHRNWILSPTAQQFGTGDAPAVDGARASNVLRVVEPAQVLDGPSPTIREASGFVAWPTSGYNPAPTVFQRWSFSLRDADFRAATVTTQRLTSGSATNIASPIVHQQNAAGAPYDILVWEPALEFPADQHGKTSLPTPAVDQTYRVTISNVIVGGAARSFTYDVIVIGEQEAPRVPSISSANEAFVNAAFEDFLGRDATPSERQDWVAQLLSGTPRHALIADLAQSDEWVGAVVDRMYRETLGRNPEAAGRAFWIDRIQNGTTVADAAASFYGSPEYVANEGGSIDRWVDDLYAELLGRQADDAGRTHWVRTAESQSTFRVAAEIYRSPESRQARVQSLYQDLLERQTDAAGEAFWAERLLDGNDLALAIELASSDEYFAKAQR